MKVTTSEKSAQVEISYDAINTQQKRVLKAVKALTLMEVIRGLFVDETGTVCKRTINVEKVELLDQIETGFSLLFTNSNKKEYILVSNNEISVSFEIL